MKLSILICTIAGREFLFEKLLLELYDQIFSTGNVLNVEVLFEHDNKEISTGAKRMKLLLRARGERVVWIDDDDWPEPHYIYELMKACASNADCFGINGTYNIDGGAPVKWILSKDNENEDVVRNGERILLRKTNHITAVKREHALKAGFPDKSNAEDKWYSDALVPHLKTELIIEKPMYQYRYSSYNKSYV